MLGLINILRQQTKWKGFKKSETLQERTKFQI
jgi:hypothetical protein